MSVSASNNMDHESSFGRVFQWWPRDPKGPFLDKNKAPKGRRTPNRIMWGHTLNDFYYISRMPNINVATIWSRSMIEELGEDLGYDPDDEPQPRKRRPWPLLKLPNRLMQESSSLGIIDDTDWEHDGTYLQIFDAVNDEGSDGETATEEATVWSEGPTSGSAGTSQLEQSMQVDAVPSVDTADDDADTEDNINSDADSEDSGDETSHEGCDSEPEPQPRKMPPKLEEFIPREYFPDVLLVHNTDGCLARIAWAVKPISNAVVNFLSTHPIKFERVLHDVATSSTEHLANGKETPPTDTSPAPPASSEAPDLRHERKAPAAPRTAHLHVYQDDLLGRGNHSLVLLAAMNLPKPLSARTPSHEVSVACKVAFRDGDARLMLENEADIYNAFPEHLQEEWCGLNMIPPIPHPMPIGAVVPKFYGYYKPVVDEALLEGANEAWKKDIRAVLSGFSPILLMEHCGTPVRPSDVLTFDDKLEVYSQILRLHLAEFTQGSYYGRNILSQPGPLTHPPGDRSWKTPSFRIIDFGRGEYLARVEAHAKNPANGALTKVIKSRNEFFRDMREEDRHAKQELYFKASDI